MFKNNLKNHIHIFKNFLEYEFCDSIVNFYKKTYEWNDANTFSSEQVRKCKVLNITESNEYFDNILFTKLNKLTIDLFKIYPYLEIKSDTGYEILKYEEGDFYKTHTDSSMNIVRTISCSINLNDDYSGGEFYFTDLDYKIKLKKGSLLLFPSNYLYSHQIKKINKGTRYSIITWFV